MNSVYSFWRPVRAVCLVPLLLSGLVACAAPPPPGDQDSVAAYQENNDPCEPTNRVLYGINAGLDTVLMRPLAVTYRHVAPEAARQPVSRLLANLHNPVILANDALQTHPRRARDTFMRLVINTTLGVGGLFDVAARFGYPHHDNDFGLTLAQWGFPSGPYLYLPLIGPSDPRDAIGYGVDVMMDPLLWPANGGGMNTFRITAASVGVVNTREKVLDITNSIDKTSLDPYATYRSLFQQHRQLEIKEARHDGPLVQ